VTARPSSPSQVHDQPREPTPLDTLLALVPYAVAALALLALLFWEAAARKTPTIFSDELEWTQLSRAIATTGRAARRGEPASFGSLYAYLIAPSWWIHSTGSAYAAIKYVNTVVMALAAVPTFLIARMLVSFRVALITGLAAICTSALYYAAFIVPEALAYPVFVLGAWVSIKALAGAGRRWTIAAVLIDLVAILVRQELATLVVSFAIAACLLWIVGPHGQQLRRGWSVFDHIGAGILLLGGLILLNAVGSPHAHEWSVVTQNYQGRIWSLGMQAASALAIGLGVLPFVFGLASLWLPGRRHDPAWRAFAAFTGSAIVTVWLYTAVKAAYLSTVFATRVEERNMIYLAPLLLVGTAVVLMTRRPWLPGLLAAWSLTTWLILHYGYQLNYPYYEAPGYGIAALANRDWHWDQPTIRIGLAVASAVVLAVVFLVCLRRVPASVRKGVIVAGLAAAIVWMLAGEITSANGSAATSRAFVANLPKPLDWVDRATGQRGTTFVSQNISTGDIVGINLLEFWNRSVRNIWSLDGTAPGPGPTLTPDLEDRIGHLSNDPGLHYVLATSGVDFAEPTVASRPGLVLSRIAMHPWRLRQARYGVSSDGWITSTSDEPVDRGTYAFFDPTVGPGMLEVDTGRQGFCNASAPATTVDVRIGPVALDEQRAPYLAHATFHRRFRLPNCTLATTRLRVTPPFAVQVVADPTVRPSDYGASDPRELGAQVGFSFRPTR